MTNHFTDLGFDINEVNDLTDLVVHAAATSDEFVLESGWALLRWAVGAGIELWMQVNHLGEVVGVHPFFLGPTRLQFLVDRVDADPSAPEDGALMGWVGPTAEREAGSEGDYPMRFDVPGFPIGTAHLTASTVCELQVAAFAEEIALYRTEQEFFDAQDEEALWNVRSFVPIGLFPPDEDDAFLDEAEHEIDSSSLLRPDGRFRPAALAMFSGVVERCESRVNPYSQSPFWWLQISTFGAEYDVVVDPALLSSEPVPGDIVQGQFWMAARVTDPLP